MGKIHQVKYKFYSQIEYRKFIRELPKGIRFETISKPREIPIILLVNMEKNLYF